MAFTRSCVTWSFESEHIHQALCGSQLLRGRTGSEGSRYKDREKMSFQAQDIPECSSVMVGHRKEEGIQLVLEDSDRAIYTSWGL